MKLFKQDPTGAALANVLSQSLHSKLHAFQYFLLKENLEIKTIEPIIWEDMAYFLKYYAYIESTVHFFISILRA